MLDVALYFIELGGDLSAVGTLDETSNRSKTASHLRSFLPLKTRPLFVRKPLSSQTIEQALSWLSSTLWPDFPREFCFEIPMCPRDTREFCFKKLVGKSSHAISASKSAC